jgi:hypothetical protein
MELVPELAVATLPLVDGLVIARSVPRVFEGAHFNAVPCVVLIDESILADRMFAADSVLHEALHQKLCDLSLIRRVLFSPADGEPKVVKIPWGAEVPRCWELSRALAAYHVYVHLAALYAAASSVAPSVIERKTAVERLYRSVWRAAHLDAEVRAHASAALGADGWALCEWLTAAIQMIAEIAAVPPSPYASR